MSYTYKGFWDPGATYVEDDLVKYYSVSGYDQPAVLYKCIKPGASSFRTSKTYPIDSVVYISTEPDWLWVAKQETGQAPNSIGSTSLWERSDTKYHCPLKYFRLPKMSDEGNLAPTYQKYITSNSDWVVVASSGSEEWVVQEHLTKSQAKELMLERNDRSINLNGRDLMSVAGNSNGWTESEYYHENPNSSEPSFWKGPNGSILEANSTFWVKVESSDPDYASIVNSEWSDPNAYDASAQEYNSGGLTTLVQGEFGSPDSSQEVSFNEVQGETDSDAYYISSVQNYKGNFDPSSEYMQFDVVRNPYSHLFCYARTDISQPDQFDTGDTIVFTNVIIKSPVENVENSRHVGTLELGQGSVSVNGQASSDFTELKIGNVLDFGSSGLAYAQNQQRFIVIGVSASILYLGVYGALDPTEFGLGDLMRAEAYDSSGKPSPVSFDVIRQSVGINIDTADHDLWSTDQFFFDADYGSSVTFNARNKIFEYGDGYQSVAPLGVNSIRMEMSLKFSNRSNREANCIVHFLENNLGQHETDKQTHELKYDQGISGFRMDGDSLFFPYRNNENLIRRFYCFNYNHQVENEDVNTVEADIINTTASTLSVASQMFVTKAEAWDADEEYSQHNVIFCPDNLKYYYSWTDAKNRSYRPWVAEGEQVTSINKHLWTREFYWKPSIPLSVSHSPAIEEFGSKSSNYTQYFPKHKQNINNLEFDLSFENRNDSEAYAIMHFLESHLGYLSFLFTPPAPYNRKRRFYCESWSHTYVFKNNHTIKAKLKQYPLGQNTPLDDDEIDNIAPKEKSKPGELSMDIDVDFNIDKPAGSDDLYLKKVIKVKNVGGKKITISSNSLTNTSKFSKSSIGVYESSVNISGKTHISDGNYSLNASSGESIVYAGVNETYIHDSNGRVFLDGLYQGVEGHINFVIQENLTLEAGEERSLEIYFTAEDSAIEQSLLTLEYFSDPAEEILYEEGMSGREGEKYYLQGNLIQYNNVVYEATADFDSTDFAGDLANLQQYKRSVTSTIDAYVNKAKNDPRKSAVYVNLDFDSSPNGQSYMFDNHGFDDSTDFYRSTLAEDFYNNIIVNASHDGCELAVLFSEEDFLSISDLRLSDGFYITRVYWDGSKYIDYNTLGDSVVDGNGTTVSAEKVLQGSLPSPNSSSVGFDWSSTSTAPGVLLVKAPEGSVEELSSSKKFTLSIVPTADLSSSLTEGYIVQKQTKQSSGSITLAERVNLSGEVGIVPLEEFEQVNIFLAGDIDSHDTATPALEFGGPWHEEVEINLYIGNATQTYSNGRVQLLSDVIRDGGTIPLSELAVFQCNIKGSGGSGGEGMVSEGEIYENGQPVGSNESYIPAGRGEDGGGALYVNGLEEEATVNIYFLSISSLRGGGGGGGGGTFALDGKRMKTHSQVNFAGGGGGGAPFGLPGPPSGKPGTVSSGGLGGIAINNDHNERTHLSDGAKGGGYGEVGGDILSGGAVIVKGGLPGYAIKIEDGFIDVNYYLYDPTNNTSAALTVSNDTIDQDFFSGKIIDV